MADLTFGRGDTSPSIYGTLVRNGAVLDLTDATVKFQMTNVLDNRYTVDAAAGVLVAADGTVRYDWAEGDLATPGSYTSRWLVTFLDATVQHTQPANTIEVVPA